MTTPTPRQLLRRKKLKGEEVGRALLLSFVHDYQQRDSDQHQPLFTQQELNQMVQALPSEYERRIYAGYAGLYERIVALYNRGQGMEQQLQNGLSRLEANLSLTERLQVLEDTLRKTPRIVQKSEWDQVEAQLRSDGGPEPSPSEIACVLCADHPEDVLFGVAVFQENSDQLIGGARTHRDLLSDIWQIFPERLSAIAESASWKSELRRLRNQVLLPAYRFLVGYRAVLGVLVSLLSLPELSQLAVDLKPAMENGRFYDDTLAHLLRHLKKQRLINKVNLNETLQYAYPPLHLEEIRPDQEALEALQNQWQHTDIHLWDPEGAIAGLVPAKEEVS